MSDPAPGPEGPGQRSQGGRVGEEEDATRTKGSSPGIRLI